MLDGFERHKLLKSSIGVMSSLYKCILFWLILVVMMILHFNYHVGDIFYGISVLRENSDGSVPIGTHAIRNIFYHLPIVWILVLVYFDTKIVRAGLFGISIVYSLSHAMHLVGGLKEPDLSQIPLLILALIVSILLSIEHFRYFRRAGDDS